MVRKVIIGVVAASAVAVGLVAGSGQLVVSHQSVEAAAVPYSPKIHGKQDKHVPPQPGHRTGGGGGSW